MKKLPNILSCCRIALSLPLLFLTGKTAVFIAVYLLCGATDIADGYFARRFDARTKLGAKLDSLGDFIFFGVALYAVFMLIDRDAFALFAPVVISITIIRAMNLAITKAKFRQWGVIHTVGNKITGVALFAVLPACVAIGCVPATIILVVGGLGALSALEESVILLTAHEYDADRKSIFTG